MLNNKKSCPCQAAFLRLCLRFEKGDGNLIAGVGIDVTELARIREAVAKHPQFAERVLTPGELRQYHELHQRRAIEYLGGRWSLKESFGKAMGTGISAAVGFQDVEIIDQDNGRPLVTKSPFSGRVHVSVSHTDQIVMTEVILEEKTK